ncbi:MAG: hypothetical protein QME76_02080 [Bacillota bacterium]|nr:hypothetical protein [Bacillota bacterium]
MVVVTARVKPAYTPRGRLECYLLIVEECPFCGRRHVHGGGKTASELAQAEGWRVSHCPDCARDYFLRVAPDTRAQTLDEGRR